MREVTKGLKNENEEYQNKIEIFEKELEELQEQIKNSRLQNP